MALDSINDLTPVRFAADPLVEAICSVLVVDAPSARTRGRWSDVLARAVRDLSLGTMRAVCPIGNEPLPSFLLPVHGLANDFARRIGELRDADTAAVRRDVIRIISRRPERTIALSPYRARPRELLTKLSDELEAYWNLALGGEWPRIQGALDADIVHRTYTLVHGGVRRFVESMPKAIRSASVYDGERTPGGRHAPSCTWVFLPSVFSCRCTRLCRGPAGAVHVQYPARGLARMWEAFSGPESSAIDRLIGRGRALVLRNLEAPATTTELAERLGLAPSSVSQHLSKLAETALVGRTRFGRCVYYRLTARGRRLLDLFETDERIKGDVPSNGAPADAE